MIRSQHDGPNLANPALSSPAREWNGHLLLLLLLLLVPPRPLPSSSSIASAAPLKPFVILWAQRVKRY
jgi:hypothetical protein